MTNKKIWDYFDEIIEYPKEIDEIVDAINKEAQSKISTHLSNRELHLSKRDAKSFCETSVIFADNKIGFALSNKLLGVHNDQASFQAKSL